MSLDIQVIVDGTVGGNKALGLALRLEALHFSLPPSDRKMGVLDPVVVSQSVRLVAMLTAQNLHCCGVGP